MGVAKTISFNDQQEMSVWSDIAEILTAIGTGIFAALLICAFFMLILVFRKQAMRYKSLFTRIKNAIRPPPTGINMDNLTIFSNTKQFMERSETQVNETAFGNSFDKMFSDDKWVDDVSGLMPHCLTILKNCRALTERLTVLSMGILNNGDGTSLKQIVECARKISSRVDDMVQSMYPPLDPFMVEARAASLVLAVSQLATIAQYECQFKNIPVNWIEKSLEDIETHVKVLRSIAVEQDPEETKALANAMLTAVV